MAKPKSKTIFVCQQCGKESPKWLGRCPHCQEWNSFSETTVTVTTSNHTPRWSNYTESAPQELAYVKTETSPRIIFPLAELNRVLGGGLVAGSLILIGGEPGIGKSTLLLQASSTIAKKQNTVVYVSGEESSQQIKLRADRLGIEGSSLYVLSETNLDIILERLSELMPTLVVVDSIQTIYLDDATGAASSITQIRECTLKLMQWAKQSNIPLLLTGHVTKDGAIAGPRALEHIVDAVLYLEGETFSSYRILRSIKNRFGSTNEVGIFEMTGTGLVEVSNPSQAFLTSHNNKAIGSAVVPTLEGSRPLLVEIQALTTPANFGPPRRIANGLDTNRLLLIAAVVTRRAGINLSNQDVLTNVVGGLKVNEPAADLGIALAIASSFRDSPVTPGLVALGEIGLSGELRAVPQLQRRIAEAARLGFNRCLIPEGSTKFPITDRKDVEVITARTVAQAVKAGLFMPSEK